MNGIIENNAVELVGDADTVATLKAANNGLPADDGYIYKGQATQQEAEVVETEVNPNAS